MTCHHEQCERHAADVAKAQGRGAELLAELLDMEAIQVRCPARADMSPRFARTVGDGPGWIACEHPERRPDENMSSFPNDCDACHIATQAAVRLEGVDQ